jgi:hypothetical protein
MKKKNLIVKYAVTKDSATASNPAWAVPMQCLLHLLKLGHRENRVNLDKLARRVHPVALTNRLASKAGCTDSSATGEEQDKTNNRDHRDDAKYNQCHILVICHHKSPR